MKEHPILFSAPMVRALLSGSKTQTRRVVKGSEQWPASAIKAVMLESRGTALAVDAQRSTYGPEIKSPYGQPGDRLWVREAFRTEESYDTIKPSLLPVAANATTLAVPFWYDADLLGSDFAHFPDGLRPGKYRPGMFIPRAASRLLLEVTGVRVERLQDISESDAQAEGVYLHDDGKYTNYLSPSGFAFHARSSYASLWESINGPDSWAANPWVWSIEFKVVQP